VVLYNTDKLTHCISLHNSQCFLEEVRDHSERGVNYIRHPVCY